MPASVRLYRLHGGRVRGGAARASTQTEDANRVSPGPMLAAALGVRWFLLVCPADTRRVGGGGLLLGGANTDSFCEMGGVGADVALVSWGV
jgi:hypothetical protein